MKPVLAALLVCFQVTACISLHELLQDKEQVTFYPTYGYLEDGYWIIPMRIYVHEHRPNTEGIVTRVARSISGLSQAEIRVFRFRIRDFVADSESLESVRFEFVNDPESSEYRLHDQSGNPVRTGLNGFKEGQLRISVKKAEKLLEQQGSTDGWLTLQAVSESHTGSGRVRLIEPVGLSVISDIDDTVKVTEIPAGSGVVIRNTFFEEYKAVSGMAEMYQEWRDLPFHYVSGAPWQLYRPLALFLYSGETQFPEGSFHMKPVRKNLFSINTWRDLRQLVSNEHLTYNQKISRIRTIKEHFPGRTFILVGDSGERDPEVYRKIQEMFPGQVKEIIIRDVTNDRENNSERLEGMTVIPAPAIAGSLIRR
ncbi:MAG: phosphatase domain-containing protein [Balneolaceae bacterium]